MPESFYQLYEICLPAVEAHGRLDTVLLPPSLTVLKPVERLLLRIT